MKFVSEHPNCLTLASLYESGGMEGEGEGGRDGWEGGRDGRRREGGREGGREREEGEVSAPPSCSESHGCLPYSCVVSLLLFSLSIINLSGVMSGCGQSP